MHEMARVSALEGQLIKQVPLGEPRYQVLGDTCCTVVAAHIQETRWDR